MKPYYEDGLITLYHADCLAVLRTLPDSSVDAIVTDPPYGLSNTKPEQVADVLKAWVTGDTEAVPTTKGGFMGAAWDGFVPPPAVWEECLRVLKPGGHMAVFAGARTQDLMGLSIRLAGFEIRDTLGWVYGSGFPKSHDIGKAIDKAAGAEREVVGQRSDGASSIYSMGERKMESNVLNVTAPATSEAKRWDGWGTALKPAIEPIILARKPLVGTVAANVLAHGVGGLNIDASRVAHAGEKMSGGADTVGMRPGDRHEGWARPFHSDDEARERGRVQSAANVAKSESLGRFPANVLLDEHAAQEMDQQSGVSASTAHGRGMQTIGQHGGLAGDEMILKPGTDYVRGHADSGGASRFFPVFKYQAKAPKRERPVIEREDGTKIQHPTVKPVALMEWLVELITPPSGVVLDPFAGSGTTLQAARDNGFNAIGVEQSADFVELIQRRLGAGQTTLTVDDVVNDGVVPDECESPTITNAGNQKLKETL